MKKIVIIVLLFCSSCSFHTAVSYNHHKKEEYVRDEGFILKCTKQGAKGEDYLIIGAYTPITYGKGYYDHLKGIKSEKKVEILDVKVLFAETGDTLELVHIGKLKSFWFQNKNLSYIIDNNKRLKVTVYLQDLDTGIKREKEFQLTRKKRTYPTGTFPHA
ncbi:hypothetical protein [uncultured Pontibacter sp.]|uniref:hypothetical protein n=1 Tax=uncultured Pontibacter sp. TaxID=453356 RepID=UPI002605E2DC|nr:hypothetical protein [uncultured Pontibacter sp.]